MFTVVNPDTKHEIAEASDLLSAERAVVCLLVEGEGPRLDIHSPTDSFIERGMLNEDGGVVWQESGLRRGFLELGVIKERRFTCTIDESAGLRHPMKEEK